MSSQGKAVLFAIAAVFILAQAPDAYGAQGSRTGTPAFVDLDGDGFNDALLDEDSNGIPDQLEPGRSGPAKDSAVKPRGAVIDLDQISRTLIASSNSQRFSLREFRTRAQRANRCNLGFWFGGVEGLGAAAAAGGLCAGGVCIPR
ncbi:MAG: hypothetical protein JSU65_13135 [Candidatus Zixiibacteriota bacterium]|nr:MAG: hypothetical protein JSU65_13135 [candidate division Zixibacteria bacterium]